MKPHDIIIVGAGAAGYFAAIACAEANPRAQVTLLEGTRRPLTKVRISGGGRCNVTHHCFDIGKLCEHYPRGHRELRGPFSRFQPKDTVAWFEARGVKLKTEGDGRMFSVTNSSQTIIDCLVAAADQAGVRLVMGQKVARIEPANPGGFDVHIVRGDEPLHADAVMLATGSAPIGYEVASQLGHSLVSPVPSLFTFEVEDQRFHALTGTSVARVALRLQVDGSPKTFKQEGPFLITHWGFSGPAVLKLSAWAARELWTSDYRGRLTINWLSELTRHAVESRLEELREAASKKAVHGSSPFAGLSKRLWSSLLVQMDLGEGLTWGQCSVKTPRGLADFLQAQQVDINGKGEFKEEFVTCGGVKLSEVNFKTMESKVCPGLFFAGEILDIDGITGGFNFQNAWTTGWIAGHALASHSLTHKP